METSTGWVKIYRQLSENPLWTSEPFSKGQAWIDLILLANHKEGFFFKRGIKINYKRGDVAWSELALSKRWQWSRTKVSKFLKDLEEEQQIRQQKSTVTQIVTIINYDKFQEKEQQKDNRKTTEEQQKDTYKNDKKEKKYNIREHLSSLGCDSKLISEWLVVRKNKKASNTETAIDRWAANVDKSNMSYNEALKVCVEKSWVGFNKEWLPKQPTIDIQQPKSLKDLYE